MTLYRRSDGIEQEAQAGTQLAEVLEADPDWQPAGEGAAEAAREMPPLDRLSRDELNAIAVEAGVDHPKSLSSKAKVIQAIQERQG